MSARAKDWLSAMRLRTLPLAISSVLVGSGLAYFQVANSTFRPLVAALAVLTAILLQILSNLANDLGDHEHGSDNAGRIGPQRAVQSGAITPRAMRRAMVLFGALAFVCGSVLLVIALGIQWSTLAFFALGLAAILAAVKYTYGKRPYGYAGIGDVSVFIFFGLVGVLGSFHLHGSEFWWGALFPAIGMGALATGVLNTNNMRDMVNDRAAGKITLVVRMGMARAKTYHATLVVGGLSCFIAFTALHFRGMPQWGFLVASPMLASQLKQVMNNMDPQRLDPELKRLALGTFLLAVAFTLGLYLVK